MTDIFEAPTAHPVFYRTYSRQKGGGGRESWGEVCDRTIAGLAELGKFTPEERATVDQAQRDLIALTSGRWLWVGGTEWSKQPENFPGSYNCVNLSIVDWRSFGLTMDFSMQGTGVGFNLAVENIGQLPPIVNKLNIVPKGDFGLIAPQLRRGATWINGDETSRTVSIVIGDSRQGWIDAYTELLYLASDTRYPGEIWVVVDFSHVRPAGEKLKGFGGTANPILLKDMFPRIAKVLNGAIGRQLSAVECCLILNEAGRVVVAGNVRRSAQIAQAEWSDEEFATAKDNLWQQDADGQWSIDPDRDALRMANHTRVFHHRPSLDEIKASVTKQYYSGEGAIQFAPEAIARANADLLQTDQEKHDFISLLTQGLGEPFLRNLGVSDDREIEHRLSTYGLNPCGEVCGADFFCNLSEVHLNRIDPEDHALQEKAFQAGALSVAALLHHRFTEERMQYSRELDPIVGVSFTGLFDFFVQAFGSNWLAWWEAGRPETEAGKVFKRMEQAYLTRWREIVRHTVWQYCDRHGLKRPNRFTLTQPAGTKSLLTGASPGWHPPKAVRYIRRITFAKNDPVALACKDMGYSIIPSQSDKDENGQLLNDPFDPRCTEWLVEIPVKMSWADLPGCDAYDVNQFSALAQFDFWMQVQRYYTGHNSSATIEIREHEIDAMANRIYQAICTNEGYVSTTLLSRSDAPFPRMPFEAIDRETYDRLVAGVESRKVTNDFHVALAMYDLGESDVSGPAGCDSDKCMLPEKPPA